MGRRWWKGSSTCPSCCVSHRNGDGRVDVVDIMLVVAAWNCAVGDPCYETRCDINDNGLVNLVDVMQVVGKWRWPCP